MTTAFDHGLQAINRLIDSCRESEWGFRTASQTIANDNLKRLFSIYAQQRGRFAQELRSFAPYRVMPAAAQTNVEETVGLLRECLEREQNTLALYRQVHSDRNLPTKAHFLVSAQLALLERVHSRIEALRPLPVE